MSSNNIANACKIIYDTCGNVEKLVAFLNVQANEKGKYIPCTLKPLRLRGNSEFNDEVILVFRKKQDKKSLYVVDISLWNNDIADNEIDEAKVFISKFKYANTIDLNKEPILKGSFWQFSEPICMTSEIIDIKSNGEFYDGVVRDNSQADEDYRGLRSIVGFPIPLIGITSDSAYKDIFGGFDKLSDK